MRASRSPGVVERKDRFEGGGEVGDQLVLGAHHFRGPDADHHDRAEFDQFGSVYAEYPRTGLGDLSGFQAIALEQLRMYDSRLPDNLPAGLRFVQRHPARVVPPAARNRLRHLDFRRALVALGVEFPNDDRGFGVLECPGKGDQFIVDRCAGNAVAAGPDEFQLAVVAFGPAVDELLESLIGPGLAGASGHCGDEE
jgi:hypothetical protein